MEKDLLSIQKDAAEMNSTVVNLSETQTVHGTEIDKHEDDLKDVFNRLKALETAVPTEVAENAVEGSEVTWATRFRNPRAQGQIQDMVRSQINEQAEIEKIKMNLVISGMKETNSDEVDKTAVLELIEKELDIVADINKTERIGKPRIQKRGEDLPPPRLIKLQFVTQRSRKEVLAKVTELRKSSDEHVKKLVYIRPDLTKAQLEESKNLRALLKTTRENNPGKVYKIQRNQVIEVILTAPQPMAAEIQVTEDTS